MKKSRVRKVVNRDNAIRLSTGLTQSSLNKEMIRKSKSVGLGEAAKSVIRESVSAGSSSKKSKSQKKKSSGNKKVQSPQNNKRNGNKKNRQGKQQQPKIKKNMSKLPSAASNKTKISKELRSFANDMYTFLYQDSKTPATKITDRINESFSKYLGGTKKYLSSVYQQRALIRLSEADSSSILDDIAFIDEAVASNSSAEMLKASRIVFSTVQKYLSVAPTPVLPPRLFDNISVTLQWSRFDRDTSGDVLGTVKDVRQEPDVAAKVPVYVLPITARLKTKLADMGITQSLIDELDNYAPGQNHDGASDKKGVVNADGTIGWNANLPEDYLGPKVYDSIVTDLLDFIRQVDTILGKKLIDVQTVEDGAETVLVDLPRKDFALMLWIQLAMNAAHKLILEQPLSITDLIVNQLSTDLARFKPASIPDIANLFILSNKHILERDLAEIQAVYDRVDLPYNKKVYDMLKPVFREHFNLITSKSSKYYLGNKELGSHSFITRVVPYLVLPAPINVVTAQTAADNAIAKDKATIPGKKLYRPVRLVKGRYNAKTMQLEDLDTQMDNMLALHIGHMNAAQYNSLAKANWDIDKDLYIDTYAASYGINHLSIPAGNLGNHGVGWDHLDGSYPDGDLGDTGKFATKISAHMAYYCSQLSFGFVKTFKRFAEQKLIFMKNTNLVLSNSLEIKSHPSIAYTEKLVGNVNSTSPLSKNTFDVKLYNKLTPVKSGSVYTYVHQDNIGNPVYLGRQAGDTSKYDIKLSGANRVASITKDSIMKLLKKFGRDHMPSFKDTGIRIGFDATTGLMGYQSATGAAIDFKNDRTKVLEIRSSRPVPMAREMTHIVQSGSAASGVTYLQAHWDAIASDIKDIMANYWDPKFIEDSAILTEVIDEIFAHAISKTPAVLIDASEATTGLAALCSDKANVDADITRNVQEVLGQKFTPMSTVNTPFEHNKKEIGLAVTVKSNAIYLEEEDFYPETIDLIKS